MNYLAIAFGEAVGSVLRFWLSTTIQGRIPINLPLGTFAVNAAGSLLIGLFYVVILQRFHGNEILRVMLIVGLLGGFTTFSTFSLETLQLFQYGFWSKAIIIIIGSFFVCTLFAYIGIALGRWTTSN